MLMKTYNLYYDPWRGFTIENDATNISPRLILLIYNVENAYTVVKHQICGYAYAENPQFSDAEIIKTFDDYIPAMKYMRKCNRRGDSFQYSCVSPVIFL